MSKSGREIFAQRRNPSQPTVHRWPRLLRNLFVIPLTADMKFLWPKDKTVGNRLSVLHSMNINRFHLLEFVGFVGPALIGYATNTHAISIGVYTLYFVAHVMGAPAVYKAYKKDYYREG